ncbi:MAG: hypothetical protein COA84_13780 [Robiginitomaculum sp.]|nr:MAG: hypothetical protein COA84_13780 [Robiginitomaculum sp.]
MTLQEQHDLEIQKMKIELENQDRKSDQQRSIVWTAAISVLIVTAILFTPMVSETRLELLGDVIQMFYITQAGIIATFFGSQAFMSRR